MIKEVTIKNYKSIFSVSLELGRVNVFIGPAGAGKTNLLEAIALMSAEREGRIRTDDLKAKGMRITEPGLMIGSFYGKQRVRIIEGALRGDIDGKLFHKIYRLVCDDWENDRSDWVNAYKNHPLMTMERFIRNSAVLGGTLRDSLPGLNAGSMEEYKESLNKFKDLRRTFGEENSPLSSPDSNYVERGRRHLADFRIYSPETAVLRAGSGAREEVPLGIAGEGLEKCLLAFDDATRNRLQDLAVRYAGWLKEILVAEPPVAENDEPGELSGEPQLYLTDRFMLKKNNRLRLEQIDEGTLRLLFYLSLFLCADTASFFALEHPDQALDPSALPGLTADWVRLARETDRQVLITTGNPALLDGLDTEDPDVCLFRVYRNSDGQTEVGKIRTSGGSQPDDPLSFRWLRGEWK